MRNACVRCEMAEAEKEKARLRIVRFILSHSPATRDEACTHGSTTITASRHHLYLRDTAKPCPGRIVTAQGPYNRLGLIGTPRYLAHSFLSSRWTGWVRGTGPEHRSYRDRYRSRLIGFNANARFRECRPSRNRVIGSRSKGGSGGKGKKEITK